jgi:formiminotetrahydrofolate cyclodeaminase
MKLADQKIKQFLEELASKRPAPGGGSASALAGAMAATLVNKVASLTIGKEKYKKVEEEFKRLNREALKLQEELIKLVDADTEAFMAVMRTKGSQQAIKPPVGCFLRD